MRRGRNLERNPEGVITKHFSFNWTAQSQNMQMCNRNFWAYEQLMSLSVREIQFKHELCRVNVFNWEVKVKCKTVIHGASQFQSWPLTLLYSVFFRFPDFDDVSMICLWENDIIITE